MSTINYTYNVIVDRFRQFAAGHFQLRRFTHGEISQADLEKEAEWPWLHVKPRAINYSPGTRSFQFEIFISDLPRDKEDKTGYQAESITDCSLIFQDLINEIYLGNMFGTDVVLTRPVNSEPFVEQYTHTLTGVTGTIELQLDYDWSACSIPASWNYNTPTDSGSDGWGALQFIESLDQNGAFVSLLNDEETPGNSYYYGTNSSGVKGWYAIVDNVGLTCETLPECATIISIVDDIAALQSDKVDKIAGKGLSTEDYTTAEKSKLAGIQAGAEVNVNADWNATSGDAQILNKPTIPSIAGLVPDTRTITINGTTQDLSANRTFSVGTFNLPSLTSGSVLFSNGTTIAQDNANLFWDDTNNRLGIGTATPASRLEVNGNITIPYDETAFMIGNNNDVGIVKKIGAQGFYAFGSAFDFVVAQSNTTNIFPSNAFTPRLSIGATDGILRNGNGILAGNAFGVDNYGIEVRNELAMVKKSGGGAFIAYPANRDFFIAQSTANSVAASNTFNRRLTINQSSGNVLINTTTDAGYRLDVNGSVRATGSISAAAGVGRGTLLNQTLVATANNDVLVGLDIQSTFTLGAFTGVSRFPLRIRNAANDGSVFGISSDGVVRWGNRIESGNTTGQLSWDTDLVFINAALNLGFRTGGTDRMRIFSTGNVGIGTTTDIGFRLDVNGTARVTGNITGNAAITAATQVTAGLTTNNNGARYILNGASLSKNWQIANNWNVGGAFEITSSTTAGGSTFTTPNFVIAGATGNVLIGTTTDVASSILTLASTTKGFLPPRMTNAQRLAIASPAVGLIVYCTDAVEGLYVNKSTGWTFVI
jgi:hypothetical protein